MITIEKTENGVMLNVWAGDHWERHLFNNMEELEIHCHAEGMIFQ